jgi:hypothetical protein
MIAARRLQRKFADGFIAEAVEDLWEPRMRHADAALEDDTLLLLILYNVTEAISTSERCPSTTTMPLSVT